MKALSLKQPYANFILFGKKTIETRLWKTSYRGDILICSSLKPMNEIIYGYDKYVDKFNLHDFNYNWMPGHALCIVTIKDIRPMVEADQDNACCEIYLGAYSWLLENIRMIVPFPVKGQLNIFDVDIINFHIASVQLSVDEYKAFAEKHWAHKKWSRDRF